MKEIAIIYKAPSALKNNPNNARRHSDQQLAKLEVSIRKFGFLAPVLVDAENMILAGHGRVKAATSAWLEAILTVLVTHLSQAQCRAYMLADNKIADLATYDEQILAQEFEYLLEQAGEIEITDIGFEIAEVDLAIERLHKPEDQGAAKAPLDLSRVEAVCRAGDLWLLGEHQLFCGDALDPVRYRILLRSEKADMIFADPPYNIAILGVVSGLGKNNHGNFAMASGEMSDGEFSAFLTTAMQRLAEASRDGSLHYICMDWRQIALLIAAGSKVYDDYKALCVWNKGRGSMGALYRSAHELVAVFKHGSAQHTNNVMLGQWGRNRTNVWSYPGMGRFGRGRAAALAMHPTVKNLAMVADAILDCTRPGDLVLDSFAGSGTTALSGQRMERPGLKALMAMIDEGQVDVIVVYKVDRLTRSLSDFAKIVERLDARQASFVSVTLPHPAGKVAATFVP